MYTYLFTLVPKTSKTNHFFFFFLIILTFIDNVAKNNVGIIITQKYNFK